MQLKLTRQPNDGPPPPKSGPSGRFENPGGRSNDALGAEDAANYITEIVAQLEAIALGSRLDLLAYFLRLAQFEARSAAKASRQTGMKMPADPTGGVYQAGRE